MFDAALACGPGKRQEFVNRTCAGDEWLKQEVASLLAADGLREDLFDTNAAELYMKIIAEETLKDDLSLVGYSGNEISSGMIIDQHWEILERLDAGGMGEVFKARDLKFDRRVVVVKVLRKESQTNPWKLKKFGHEGDAQSRIKHENVATVFDRGALPGGEPYLVMELVNGVTLRQVMKDHKQSDQSIDFSLVAEIMKQLGSGLRAIHEAGLIHRDLKPENIMIEVRGHDVRVKIIDFGIVRVLDTTTVAGQAVGTPLYMSPEQLRAEDAGFASDTYAVAAIAYELLTGRRPFETQNAANLLELQKRGVKLRPRQLREDLPQVADNLIIKGLSYETGKRPADFTKELARALIVSPTVRPHRFSKLQLVAAALIFVVAGAALWGWWRWRQPTPAPPQEAPRAERALTYALNILRQRDGKKIRATSRETFDTGDEFSFAFTPTEAGALYVFNEGTGGNWHLLFPTNKLHNGNSRLKPFEPIETDGNVFTNRSGAEKGTERVWIVWAAAVVPELEQVVATGLNSGLTISNPTQQSVLRDFMAKHHSPPPTRNIDKERSQFTIKGRTDVLVDMLELEHEDWK